MDERSSEPDILEQEARLRLPRLPSPGWRPSRGASILAAVTLAIGLAAGYAVGHGQGRGTVGADQDSGGVASGTTVTVAPPASADFGSALTEDPGTCSVQAGRRDGGAFMPCARS